MQIQYPGYTLPTHAGSPFRNVPLLKIMMFVIFVGIFGKDARSHMADTLLLKLEASETDLKKVRALNELSHFYSLKESLPQKDTSLLYSQQAESIAREIGDSVGLAEALFGIGKYHVGVSGDYPVATPYLLESLSLFELHKDSLKISECHMQLGLISFMLEYYEEAVEQFRISTRHFKNNATSNYLLAIAYTELDSFRLARRHFDLTIDYFKKDDERHWERLNESYMYLGDLFLRMNVLDSAFYYIQKAADNISNRSQENPNLLVRPYAFLSEVYLRSGDADKAIEYGELSYHMETRKFNTLADEISLIRASKSLSQAYAYKGNFMKAYFYMDVYHDAISTMASGSTKQKIANMRSFFEFDKRISEQKIRQQKDYELAQAELKLTKNIYLFTGLGILLLAVGLYSRLRFVRKSRAAIQREKDRSEELLLNILPEEVAEELKNNGKAEAQFMDPVTVLFTDFKGFTSLSEQMSPRELVHDLNICFSTFDLIVEKYGIEKIKTIGDAYMAAGGLPTANPTHANDVIRAALEMRDFIEMGKQEKIEKGEPYFEIRIGVHTGPVVAGIVGVRKFQYDIWGDTVNTASRMESSGKVGKVNVSESTYELLQDETDLEFDFRGMVKAKGKGELKMYFVDRKENFEEQKD